jgi:hypothetical protein
MLAMMTSEEESRYQGAIGTLMTLRAAQIVDPATLNVAHDWGDPACDRQADEHAHPRHRREQSNIAVHKKPLPNPPVYGQKLLIPQFPLHEQLVHSQTVRGVELHGLQPLLHLYGLEGLGWPIPFQISPAQNLVDLIEGLCSPPHQSFPHHR